MNPFQPKKVRIVTDYVPKDRVNLQEIRKQLHPCNLHGTAPNKSKVDSLNQNRIRDISRKFNNGNR